MSSADRQVVIRFHDGAEIPPVEEGDLKTFVVAVKNAEGKITCFAVDYLNQFPLWCEDEGEGIANGWFDHFPDDDGTIIRPMYMREDSEIVGWCAMDEIARNIQQVKEPH